MATPEEKAETASVFQRLYVRLMEVNILLRGLSSSGNRVPVDLVERVDSLTGTDYTEIVLGQYEEEPDVTGRTRPPVPD
jgi:hypothetical protein